MHSREYQVMCKAEDGHWWYRALRREVARWLDRAAGRNGGPIRWLDAGCGTGGLLAGEAPRRAGWQAVGVDVTDEAVALAQQRGIRRLVQASVDRLPFPEGSFDIVTSLDVLYHLRVDPLAALAELRRVLRPGGMAVLQVPAFEWLRSEHDVAIATRQRYTRAQFERLLGASGFCLRDGWYRNSVMFPGLALVRLLRRPGRHAEAARSDVTAVPAPVNQALFRLLAAEDWLSARRIRLPFGLSVFCVVERGEV